MQNNDDMRVIQVGEWYVAMRESVTKSPDVLITGTNPLEVRDSGEIFKLFVMMHSTSKGRVYIHAVDQNQEEDAARWELGGTTKKAGMMYDHVSLALADVIGQMIAGQGTLYDFLREHFGETYDQFCAMERAYLNRLVNKYKWDPAERVALTHLWVV